MLNSSRASLVTGVMETLLQINVFVIVQMCENASEERNTFSLIMVKICSNLGSERSYKGIREVKEEWSKVCRWLIPWDCSVCLLQGGSRAVCSWQGCHWAICTKLYKWQLLPAACTYPADLSTFRLSANGSFLLLRAGKFRSWFLLPVWAGGSGLCTPESSFWLMLSFRGERAEGMRIWWERGSGSWWVPAGAEEFECRGSVVSGVTSWGRSSEDWSEMRCSVCHCTEGDAKGALGCTAVCSLPQLKVCLTQS